MAKDNYTFSQVPKADIPRSSFNRSHGYKTTFDAGLLIPVYVDEALPGDTFNVKAHLFGRLATPIVPILDNLYLDIFFFAVPNRLVWEHWQAFCGEQAAPNDTTDYTVPRLSAPAGGFDIQSIYDYMGMPPKVGAVWMSALFPRAYALIWNEWFRDENLQDPIAVPKNDGPDLHTFYELKRRGKRHDYFTSALPWPQKGPGVTIPIGGSAPVRSDGGVINMVEVGNAVSNESALYTLAGSGLDPMTMYNSGGQGDQGLIFGSQTGLVADLTQATATTINSLREAFQIQKIYERDARGGTRYTEILRSHFGVVSPDARLQRPEFLGGGSTPININPVTQTSGTAQDPTTGYTPTPQGNLSAFGVFGTNSGFTKSFVEHSIIIGLVAVRADLTYQQGVPRLFSREKRFDYYWPALSHLGEQDIKRKEIFATGTADDNLVFGYQERWAEYRYFPSQITGKFRSNTALPAESLDVWHLAQNFLTAPTLSEAFIEDRPPLERILAITDEPQILFDSHFSIKAVRPMPSYSVPGFIDHF